MNCQSAIKCYAHMFFNHHKPGLIIVLDNVRSAHNVGAIFRTADAFLTECIYLCGITPIPPSRDIHKTALGAETYVPWQYAPDIQVVLQTLKQQGYMITIIEQMRQAMSLTDFAPKPKEKYCLVFGHEVHGVSKAAMDSGDLFIQIPQYGIKNSLNVSTAVGIVLWETFKKLYALSSSSS